MLLLLLALFLYRGQQLEPFIAGLHVAWVELDRAVQQFAHRTHVGLTQC